MFTLITLVVSSQALAQIGPPLAPPVSVVRCLSLAGEEGSPPLLLCVYRLRASTEKQPLPTAEQIVPVVRELFASADGQAKGVFLNAVNNRLIVRHHTGVQRQVLLLLVQLNAIDPPKRGGSFGLESVVPVVGHRTGAAPSR
jgi:hypothetical protein